MAEPARELKEVTIWSDGSCASNPGPGGYAAILIHGKHRTNVTGAFRRTTNNRMEMMAAIAGLSALKKPCRVTLHSDSRYLVDGISKKWARAWRARGWVTVEGTPVRNKDLWSRLATLCERHSVQAVWVRGHAGNRENEEADRLAGVAARGTALPADLEYEREEAALRATLFAGERDPSQD